MFFQNQFSDTINFHDTYKESKKPDYEIIRIHKDVTKQWEELRQQCFDLRIEVFHHEQGFPLETEVDGLEDIATHFLLRLRPSSKPIGLSKI
ncbi:hypothetical protein ABKN59_007064 [Abortiporus biennis]